MAGLLPSNPLKYLTERQYDDRSYIIKQDELIRERLNIARNLYKKDLIAHYGCVNAIEFSNKGEFLASGGDDRRVLIWNMEKAIQGVGEPTALQAQHSSNIFCLGFDSTLSKIFSGGNDDQVIVHDVQRGTALDNFLHEQPVYGISIDPLNDNVFASACDDGRILIYDIREPPNTEPFCLAQYNSAFHAVMFNPVEPRVITTANSKEGVGLWDIRTPKKIVVHFGGPNSFQSCMSVRFNSAGTKILALRRRLPPVIYVPDSPTHLCQFDHAGYYNSCTMKSCSFAGDCDQYVLSGSDNFNLYMWKVPTSDKHGQWIRSAHMVLEGHRSIVNQVRFDPTKGVIASSGVEKLIKLWSPFKMPNSSGSLYKGVEDRTDERKVYSHEQYINLVRRSGEFMSHDYTSRSTQEDPRMMAFFDSLVQREIEGWTSEDGSSDESIVEESLDTESLGQQPADATYSYSRGSELQAIAEAYVEALESVSPASPSEPNRISQLIARKRAQLMRLAQPRPLVPHTEDQDGLTQTVDELVLPSYSQAGNSGTIHNGANSTPPKPHKNTARKRRRVRSSSTTDSSDDWDNSTKVLKICSKSEISSSSSSSSENEENNEDSLSKMYGKKCISSTVKSHISTLLSTSEEDVENMRSETEANDEGVNECSYVTGGTSDSSGSDIIVTRKKSFMKQSPTSSFRKKTSKLGSKALTDNENMNSTTFQNTVSTSENLTLNNDLIDPHCTNENSLTVLKPVSFIQNDNSDNYTLTQFYDSYSSEEECCNGRDLLTPSYKVRNGSNSTPDSGIAMTPCSSKAKMSFICSDQAKKALFSYDNDDTNGSNSKTNGNGANKEDNALDPDSDVDWQTFKRFKNRIQGERRNYRKQKNVSDSDSN